MYSEEEQPSNHNSNVDSSSSSSSLSWNWRLLISLVGLILIVFAFFGVFASFFEPCGPSRGLCLPSSYNDVAAGAIGTILIAFAAVTKRSASRTNKRQS